MDSENHAPRPHDHLVEPFFAGLGYEPGAEAGEGEGAEVDARGGPLATLRGWLRALARRAPGAPPKDA